MTDAIKLAIEALEAACGNRCNAEYNPCWEYELADKLKAMQPVEPCAWMRKDGDLITAQEKRPDYAYTHYYDTPLYTPTNNAGNKPPQVGLD